MIKPPMYDEQNKEENETPYMYMKRVEEYFRNLKKNEYKCILDFINNIDCYVICPSTKEQKQIKYKSLCEFKNVVFGANKNILRERGPIIAKNLKIEFDFEKITKNSIFDFLKIILQKIGYSLVFKNHDENTYYTIIGQPPKYTKPKKKSEN